MEQSRCKWLVFVSQTGSEVLNLIHLFPNLDLTVVTNNIRKLREEVWKNYRTFILPRNPTVEDYESLNMGDYDIISLHGWLRIIPGEITRKYNIVNGHPGLITRYPELKGKDPQERAFKGHYLEVGAVVHKVVEEVDGGEVLEEESIKLDENKTYTLQDYYDILHKESERCWVKYIKKHWRV